MDSDRGRKCPSQGLPVSGDVRADHRKRLVAELTRRGLDGALVYSWERGAVTWLTGYYPGFRTNYAALWLPARGEPVLGTRHRYEAIRAAVSGIRASGGVKPIDLVPSEVRRLGLIGGDLAIDETPPALLVELEVRGIDTEDLTSMLDDWRAIKSRTEIEALTRAAELGRAALQAAGDRGRIGETDYEIAARAESAARRLGAARALCLIGVGDGAVVTEATGVPVGARDVAGIEITLCLDGFWMQVNGTLLPEPAPDHQRRALLVCYEARRAILDALVPGTPIDDVVAAGDGVLARYGLLECKEYDFGHGVGADTPEHPLLVAGTGRTIQSGSVITAHVALRSHRGETAFIGGPVVVEGMEARELLPDAPWALP